MGKAGKIVQFSDDIALLLETWADDALIPIALNTRWSHPENYPAFREEGGKALFPFAPAFIRNRIIDNTAAKRMREASQRMGVTESQIPTLNQWTEELLDTLNQHLSQHKYLLGGKPCIADYSLTGLFYAHLNHDAWPERVLMRPRPALQDYTHRTHGGSPANESWLNSDSIADTLTPLLQRISREFIPMITATAKAIEHTVNDRGLNAGDPVPRTLKDIAVPMGDDTYTRHSFSYSVWMMQRVQNIFLAMSDTERTDVSDYLDTQGIPLATLDLGPPLKRRGLGTALA